jgi:hypothetical protein
LSFRLHFRTDHSLLGRTATERGAAVAQILRQVAAEAEAGRTHGHINDADGHRIGDWSYKHGLFEDVVGDVMADTGRRRS